MAIAKCNSIKLIIIKLSLIELELFVRLYLNLKVSNHNTMKKGVFILVLFLSFQVLNAQERLQPGKIYDAGEELFAPMVGFRGIVPEGWFGTLPQEEEVFLMIPNTSKTGYMFINANRGDIEELSEAWMEDFSLTDEITISIKGKPTLKEGRLTGEFDVIGTQVPFVGFAEAMDGQHGFTISMILLSPVSEVENFKKDFMALVNSANMEKPSLGSRYDDFNWPEFLGNKYLMSYMSASHYREQNEVWLCGDGTFKSKIKSGGIVKGEKSPYKGRNKGTWRAEGKGSKGKLYLDFKKKNPLVVDMEIRDDKIFANGERFFALENTECK
jgi:hypothetical protein